MKVCHLTSAHPQEDIRIFRKECVSLARRGYEVYQISGGETYEKAGVRLIGVGDRGKGRAGRMIFFARRIYRAALALDADVYHFHDPELLPWGLRLKRRGKKVIFDSHEDVPAQLLDKGWIPAPLRKLVSGAYKAYETFAVRRFDAVVAATPHIGETFAGRVKKVVVVNNYPMLDDVVFQNKPFSERDRAVCYAGGISEVRGEKVMVEAMRDVNGILRLAGNHKKETLGSLGKPD